MGDHDRIDRLERKLDENAARTAGLAATVDVLREDAPKYAPKSTVDRLAEVQSTHGEDIAVLKSMSDHGNSARGALGGLSGLFRTALAGDPKALVVLLVGLPFTLWTLGLVVAAALGTSADYIDATGRVLHGPPSQEITVEGSRDGREGGTVRTDGVEADDVDVNANEVNVNAPADR